MKGKFVTNDQCKPETLENGIVRTVKGYIGDMMVVELRWKKGMEGAVHAHPHRQCTYILKGVFEANLDGEKKLLSAGECLYIEANVPHGILVRSEDGVLLDIFTPMREDFLP